MTSTFNAALILICYSTLCAFVFINDLVTANDFPVRLVFCNSTSFSSDSENVEGMVISPGYPQTMAASGRPFPHCSIFITGCSNCRIRISDLKLTCPGSGNSSCAVPQWHLYVNEPGYHYLPSRRISPNTSDVNYLDSHSRTVELVFSSYDLYLYDLNWAFSFKFFIFEAPSTVLRGSIGDTGTISSLFFPNKYATNGDLFTFYIDSVSAGFIRINVSDWRLSKVSRIKFYLDGVRSTVNSVVCDFRSERPFILSRGSSILIDFETGVSDAVDEDYVGFKATYEIVEEWYWPDKPKVNDSILSAVYGGQISVSSSATVDYIWIFQRSDITDPKAQLKLRIDRAFNMRPYELEIHRGITSEGEAVGWSTNSTILEPSGLYVRLKRSPPVSFSAVFTWTTPSSNRDLKGRCRAFGDFQCRWSMECVSSSLKCDGLQNCDDGTDEDGCDKVSSTCPSFWKCKLGSRIICTNMRCDGIRDCLDSSDELNCAAATTSTTTELYNDYFVYHHYGTFSVTVPVVIVTVLIVLIVCFTISFNVRRRLQIRNIRRTARVLRPERTSISGASSDNEAPFQGQRTLWGQHYLMEANPPSPPSYDDIVLYSNQGFATSDSAPPPAYTATAKPDDGALTDAHMLPPPPYLEEDQGSSTQRSHPESVRAATGNNS